MVSTDIIGRDGCVVLTGESSGHVEAYLDVGLVFC